MKRKCEICGCSKTKLIYHQKLVLPANYRFHGGYDVVVCEKCGFIFASNPIQKKKLEDFYRKNVKYAYKVNDGVMPPYAIKLHEKSSSFIDHYLKKNYKNTKKREIKILDVGCATGHLLYCLKKRGYKNLLGIDPVLECREIARKKYQLTVMTKPFSEYKTKEKYDLIMFASVLEHMVDIDKVIKKSLSLLKPNGFLFISVPDTANFGVNLKEPFLEFSLEHINFFTRKSLENLLGLYGFKNLFYRSISFKSYGLIALDSLWQREEVKSLVKYDDTGKIKINDYISRSLKRLDQIKNNIQKLVKTQEEIIIWGAGSLTSRLLATTNLASANIKSFIDNNPSLQDKEINGIKISSPNILKNNKNTIFISSYIHKNAIKRILLQEIHYQGKIVSL